MTTQIKFSSTILLTRRIVENVNFVKMSIKLASAILSRGNDSEQSIITMNEAILDRLDFTK